MAGRPSKLTPERAQAIALAVSEGHYLQHAAAAGVARSTVHSWLARGRAARERLDGAARDGKENTRRTVEATAAEPQTQAEEGKRGGNAA